MPPGSRFPLLNLKDFLAWDRTKLNSVRQFVTLVSRLERPIDKLSKRSFLKHADLYPTQRLRLQIFWCGTTLRLVWSRHLEGEGTMSSFLSAEDFNALMATPQPQAATVTSGSCDSEDKSAFTIPTSELLAYGSTTSDVVPHQSEVHAVQQEPRATQSVQPQHDPKAKPTCGLNLRLNDYQLELIRSMAEREERSMQQVVKRMLIPALEAALHEAA